MSAEQQRWRERPVNCWCFSRCQSGPRELSIRTRDGHLERDKELREQRMGLGLGADHDLDLAIHRNESSQAADTVLAVARKDTSSEDDDGSNSTSSSRSTPSQSDALPSQGKQVLPSIPTPPAVSPSSRGSSPAQFNNIDFNVDQEDGIPQFDDYDSPPLDDVNDPDQLGEHEEYAEYEQQLQDGEAASDLDSEDIDALHLFSDESEDEDGVPSSDDDNAANSEVGQDDHEEEPDDDAAVDARVHSRHAQDLFDQLVSGYRLPPRPVRPPDPYTAAFGIMQRLNPSEIASLRHIRTCIRTNATQEQYRAFAKNIEAQDPDITILGRKAAIALAKRVTRLREHTWDMCPESCMAFVGPHANLQRCNSIRQGRRCGAARFDSKGKPRRTYTTLSILPRVRAKFASGSGSTYLHDQAEWSARTWGTDEHHFADWPDGACHQHLREKGFFDDPRHDAYVLSTDGAQFVSKRKSNGWIVMLSSLNELHTKRFKRPETFVSCVVPGPNNPVNVDSFLWPVVQELARAAHGYWIWDGAREEWFLWRAWLVATAADQQGSSKINHMTGPTGYCGCRNCHMVANYAYEGQSVGYFPLKTVKGDKARTRDRPQQYDPYDLPLRSEDSFEENLTELSNSLTAADRRETRRLTGVGGRPLLAFSPAFMVPLFFPVDVFHLFGSNIPSLIWNTLTTEEPDDPFPLTKEHQELFTTLLEQSARDLPSSFSNSAPRTPTTNAGSYYKMYEWTLVTYLYLPSFLYAIGAPLSLVQMLSHLQAGVRLAMSDRGISASELDDMHDHFVQFVRLWEQEFVRGKASLLHRATISIHQLLHVRMFIYCHGNMRNTSQGRCEREVGHIKYALRSFKSPFPSIARNVRELEHIRLLDLLLQDAEDEDDPPDVPTLATKISSKHRRMTQSQVDEEDALIRTFQEQGIIPTPLPPYFYRGKLEIPGTSTVRGSRIESDGARRCCHFFARHDDGISYGKAMHFICFGADHDLDDEAPVNDQAAFIIFRRLQDVVTAEGIIKGRWSSQYFILDIRTIIEPVAICEFGGWVYVLRRLSWLTDHDEAD